MKTVFDKTTNDALIARIKTLNDDSKAQWGKMTVYQMIKHCRLWEQMLTGEITIKRAFMGLIFGKIALKSTLKDNSEMPHNMPTIPQLIIKETTGDLEAEKKKWIELVAAREHLSIPGFVHPFFGLMTKEQVGYQAYKHIDHHLRQFNS